MEKKTRTILVAAAAGLLGLVSIACFVHGWNGAGFLLVGAKLALWLLHAIAE